MAYIRRERDIQDMNDPMATDRRYRTKELDAATAAKGQKRDKSTVQPQDLGGDLPGAMQGGSAAPEQAAPVRQPAESDYDRAIAAMRGADERVRSAGEGGRTQPDDSDYRRAMDALRQTEKNPPSYSGGYDDAINELYAKITGRGDFSYKLDEDAVWQQLKDDYTRMGKQAMQDTMGRAAALTGGYGSSYGQMAGQTAYDQYLTELTDKAPELAQAAYQRWRDEGTEMRQNLDFLLDRDADAYNRYRDEYNRFLTERDYAAGQERDAYDRMLAERAYGDERDDLAYQRALQERDYATSRADVLYGRQEKERAYLDALMQMGYQPTDEEIANAGMTPAQYQAVVDYYAKLAEGGAGGGGRAEEDLEETTGRDGSTNLKLAGLKSKSRDTGKEKAVSYGSGLTEQQMKPLTDAIRNAENADAATEIYNKITDYTFQQMSKEQLEQLDRAMRSKGV